jgi:hypothetical protein
LAKLNTRRQVPGGSCLSTTEGSRRPIERIARMTFVWSIDM